MSLPRTEERGLSETVTQAYEPRERPLVRVQVWGYQEIKSYVKYVYIRVNEYLDLKHESYMVLL